jgi:hypothetical protein
MIEHRTKWLFALIRLQSLPLIINITSYSNANFANIICKLGVTNYRLEYDPTFMYVLIYPPDWRE